LLLTAQVGLPENQFDAYRTILLDELGRNGFEKDLEKVLMQHAERNGTGRSTHAGKEVPK
jgi:predicted GNAT family acetyltransferase